MMTSGVSHNTPYSTRSGKRSHSEISPSIDPLHVVGYKVYKAAVQVPDSILQEAINKSEKADAIFNHNESAKNDFKRRQCNLSASKCSKTMKEFLGELQGFLSENVSKVLKPSPWVVIHSKPRCQVQAAHCDYIPDPALATVPDEHMPLSVIVSMMPGTCLNVWPKSIRLPYISDSILKKIKPIPGEVIKLDIGDIVVFRGDFIHAGSQYKEDNYRLHAYLDSDLVERKPNSTWVVHLHGDEAIRDVIVPNLIKCDESSI